MTSDLTLHKIELTLPGNAMAVRTALKSVLGQLSESGLSESDCGITELVLAEVLNNVVEHAYSAGDPGPIELDIRQTGSILACRITDHGHPMPSEQLPTVSQGDLSCDPQDLPEGGWGWLIIHELAEDVLYTRRNGRNLLKFTLSPNRAFDTLPDKSA